MKHAFLILAHNNLEVIKSLLYQLDDKDFDIFIHINAKVKNFPFTDLEECISIAKLHFVNRVAIGYCDYSMVEGIKMLMKTASESYHDYYHIVSGADMMIKTREKFKRFFELHKGMEFVGFSKNYVEERVRYKNYFVAKCRQKSRYLSVFFIKIRKMLIAIQRKLHIENIPPYEVRKGSDWYSITHEALIHMLTEEPRFKNYFYRSYCPTEFFAQTILWNSQFKEYLYNYDSVDENNESLRIIDWERGNPYVFKIDDYEELKNSSGMFARKFDEKVDLEIVRKLKYINDREDI